jgi:hypothetical protein
MFAHSNQASGSVLNFTMRTSQHVTPLSEHDAPDDMRAALDRVWAMLFVMNGRLTECDAQLREAKGAATGPCGRDDHRARISWMTAQGRCHTQGAVPRAILELVSGTVGPGVIRLSAQDCFLARPARS